jgi:quercetin dioxygenase-like cupin family protein
MFLEAPAGWDGGFHPSPKRQMVVVARGEVEVTASDGTAVIMKPGDLAISEDLPPSKGHKSTNVGGTSGLLMIIELPALVTE